MTDIAPIAFSVVCFMAGLALGAAIMVYGFRLGFKASYEIRGSKDDEGSGLFGGKNKDPAEFGLIDKQDKEDKEFAEDET